MNCLTEVLGMALPAKGTIPAVDSRRIRLVKMAGDRIVQLVKDQICPRDIVTEAAVQNALTAAMALGCSTNTILHRRAIARRLAALPRFEPKVRSGYLKRYLDRVTSASQGAVLRD